LNFHGRNGDAPEQNSERPQHACMPYQSDSYCKLEGQYFEPTIKLMGENMD